jgi:signal transduction histidine kinase
MTIQCGYDLIREDSLDGSILSARGAPLIATALSRGLPLRLPASSTSEDLRTLGANLHLERPGHLLVAPVVNSDEKPIAGILLLSPYSNRAWSGEDQTIVSNLSASMAQLLQRTQAQASFQMGLSQAQQALQILEGEVQELRNENESMRNRLQTAQEQSEKNRVQAEALAALVAAQGESGQVQQKKAVQPDAPRLNTPQETDYLEGEMRLALEEVARLKAALQDADQRYLTLKGQLDGEAPSDEDYEEIATIVQELRQPMSSVIGYTDFLLGESVGILGALQRKFLERIKISTERINRLINELVRLTAAEMDGGKQLMPEGIDLYTAVEGAIAESIDRLREKDIALRVDVPEQLPPVSADEDAVKQVLINLIENAREITPANGEINLRASLQSGEQPQDYVLVQISDQGGGIPPEYMPRVFSRFGYANGKPIPGTGGKSSHLSVVKMLVENCGGRIWVDSLPPTGSTFSILLPVASETLERDDPGGLAV